MTGSRGAKFSDLLDNELWWNGPPFLVQSFEFWPNFMSCPENTDSIPDEAEGKMQSAKSEASTVVTRVYTVTKKFDCLIPCERYSSLNKLILITAYVLKFVRILKSRLCGNKAEPSVELLSLHDIDSAKTLLYRQVQSEFANDEKFGSQKESLNVFDDKAGVLSCKGRVENSTLPYSAKFPVLLPRKHHFTNLVILNCLSNILSERNSY